MVTDKTIDQNLQTILDEPLARNVRDAIHDAIEQTYTGVNSAKAQAETAAQNANTAAENADDASEKAWAATQTAMSGATVVYAAAEMMDTSKIYVYQGAEAGYNAGHWYAYINNQWTDKGEYKTVETDDTLEESGVPADSRTVGNKLKENTTRINDVINKIGFSEFSVLNGYSPLYYWNDTGTTAVKTSYEGGYSAFTEIPVSPAHDYHVYIRAGSSSRQHCVVFVDANYTILARHGRHSDSDVSNYYDALLTAPTNAAFALLTAYSINTSTLNATVFSERTIKEVEQKYGYLKNKTVAIMGDSISTNGNEGDNANVPEIFITEDDVGIQLSAYLTYYDVQAGLSIAGHTYTSAEIGTEVTFTPTANDIGKVIGLPSNYNPNIRKTWWEVAMDELGFNPIPVCWSGSSITSHEADDETKKTAHAWHDAQIRKCGIRTPGSMARTAPDVIIIYRGTNDFSHSPITRLTTGYFDSLQWVYPDTDYATDHYGFLEGLCLTVRKLRAAYPNATIFLCTLNVFKRVYYDNFPTRNNYNTLPEYNEAIRKCASFLGIDVIDFANDGITFENCYTGGYITDDSRVPTHPSNKGHAVMGRKAIADIKASYSPLEI